MEKLYNAFWGTSSRFVPLWLRRRLVPRLPSGFLAAGTLPESGRSFARSGFERFYAVTDDPWGFESEREHEKYMVLLDACGDGPFGRAFEVGCSIGVFTEMLAPRCEQLLAVDISDIAVSRARTRTASLGQVRCERRTLPDEMPEGLFDLVVASDVLYYWPPEVLTRAASMFDAHLAPGGRLVFLHWRGDLGCEQSGDEVHDLLLTLFAGFARVTSCELMGSRLDVLQKSATAAPVNPDD